MLKNIAGMTPVPITLNKGMHELLPPNRMNGYACLQQNWRTSPDGTRIEKRRGVANEVTDFGEDVYGYATYVDGSANFCQLAVLESQIKRKIGANAWASIHTFSSIISHPVKVLDIQGKQFIINEVDSRFVHTDGNDYQVGITAPTSVAIVQLEYTGAVEAEDCAAITDWVETEAGSGTVGIATFGGFTCFRFQGTGNPADYASITKTASTPPGKRFSVELKMYFDTFKHASLERFCYYIYYSATQYFTFSTDGYRLTVNNIVPGRTGSVGIELAEDTWYTFKFLIDTENALADVYVNDVYYGSYGITTTGAGTAGDQYCYCSGHYVASDVYIDWIKVYNSPATTTEGGVYRYAITYARSGNYGNESNPLKSKIGTVYFYGAGLNDLTVGGTYTGDVSRTIQVEIDGTGTPDTIKISYDGGITWSVVTLPVTTTVYLHYGLTLAIAATTGHASGEYWSFTCQAMSVRKASTEKSFLTAIPTASAGTGVDQRKIYRSVKDGVSFSWLGTINNNTGTVFTELIQDGLLGTGVAEDHDVMPNGNFPIWWDNRLWVFTSNTGYYSATDNPEAFDTDVRFITIRKGREPDEITGAIEYKDSVYVFMPHDIFIILKKADGTYGRYHLNNFGCDAPWSIIEANDLIMFKSQNRIELYNGLSKVSNTFSLPMQKTIRSVTSTKLDYVTSMHVDSKGEVFFSFPDLTSHWTTITQCVVVYNYIADSWYLFHYPDGKKISCMVECRDSTGAMVNKIGTRDGYLGLNESGYTDFGTAITALYYSEHITLPETCDIGFAELEHWCIAGKYLTIYWLVDMNSTPAKDESFSATAITGQYADMYKLEYRPIELGLKAKNLQVAFINATEVNGDMMVNSLIFWYQPRKVKGSYSGQ